jgi:hypothetical protein
VLKRGSLAWQRLEGRRLGERLGAPAVLIYGTGKVIVAGDCGAYPEKVSSYTSFSNLQLGAGGSS